MRLLRLITLFALSTGCVHAQASTPNPLAFRASVLAVQKQIPVLLKALNDVKIEELPINYAEGKVIEKNKDLALQNLDLLSKLSAKILRTPSLDEEINLLATVADFNNSIQELATFLLDLTISDKVSLKKTADWSGSLQALASDKINNLYKEAFLYTTARARELERNVCSPAVAPQ